MVTIHMAGKERRFADEAGAASELVARCTEQFESADGILRMAVSEHTIQELTSNETVVELWFAEPRAFVIGFNNRSVVAQRVLVPLTGELAGDVTTLFYGSGRSWAAGPLRNRRGTAAIAELAEALLAGE